MGVGALLAGLTARSAPAAAALFFTAATAPTAQFGGAALLGRVLTQRLAVAVVVLSLVRPEPLRWSLAAACVVAAATAGHHLQVRRARRLAASGRGGDRTVLAGEAADILAVAQVLARHPEHGLRPVATATVDGSQPTVLPGAGVDDLPVLMSEYAASHLLICSQISGGTIDRLVRERGSGYRVSVLPPLHQVLTAQPEVVDLRGMPLLSLAPARAPEGARWLLKRAFERGAATLALVLLAPVFAAVALAIKLDSPGPVFFRQTRVGRNGRLFRMWKFRSMVSDAEERLQYIIDLNEANGPYFKLRDDPRVTRVGKWLRRFYLDELPQLINVVIGQMGLVGPRPILPTEFASHPDAFAWRSHFLPGMTGMWQVAGRSWLPMEEGTRMDHTYLREWGVGRDLRILGRTALVALRGDRRPTACELETRPLLDRSRYLTLVEDDDLMPGAPVDVSVIVVTHESADEIIGCISSVLDDPVSANVEVIVVDNASRDGTADLVAEHFPWVRLIRKTGRHGFATNSNIGACAASGSSLLLLNPDARLRPGTLGLLVGHLLDHPRAGAVAPRLIYPDGSLQPSARRFPALMPTIVRRTPLRLLLPRSRAERAHLCSDHAPEIPSEVDWVLGAVVLVRTSAYSRLGGMDDGYRLYCEDIDLCWRLSCDDWSVHYLPTATAVHALSELTRRRFLTRATIWHFRSMARFVRLHGLRALRSGGPPRPLVDLRGGERIPLLTPPAVQAAPTAATAAGLAAG